MPASSSSPIHSVLGHLADLAGAAAEDPPGLLAVLARAADPRHRRGVRHRLAVILGLAVCAVLAGARSFTAIAEWAADADEQTLAQLGPAGRCPRSPRSGGPCRRRTRTPSMTWPVRGRPSAPRAGPDGRRVIAVDGKTLRGSGHGKEKSRRLLAAYDHAHGAVLGQAAVGGKTNECVWPGGHPGEMKWSRRPAGRGRRRDTRAREPATSLAQGPAGPGIVAASTNPRFAYSNTATAVRLEHPGFLGGRDLWEGWGSWCRGSRIPLSCGNGL
jgi:DDE_Tnp_1-associated